MRSWLGFPRRRRTSDVHKSSSFWFPFRTAHLPNWEILLLNLFDLSCQKKMRTLMGLYPELALWNKLPKHEFWSSKFTQPPNHLRISLASLRQKPWQTGLERSRRKQRQRRRRERRIRTRNPTKSDLGTAICFVKFCLSSASRVRSQRVAGQTCSDENYFHSIALQSSWGLLVAK